MAARRNAGRSVGQLLTLTFGFLLASVMIFVFGIWVGRDLGRDRQRDDRPIVVKKVDRPGATASSPTAVNTAVAASDAGKIDPRPTRPRLVPPSRTATSAVKAIKTATRTVKPTRAPAATRASTRRPPSTSTPRRKPTTVAKQVRATPEPKVTWTVQVTATNDQVQALIAARGLRAKGYEAFTVQAEVGGATWYRVQVGKYANKKKAEKTASRLRREGNEAAFVERLR